MRTARPEPGGFAAKARDLQALRDAVDQAARVSGALWLSYIFVFFYLAIAAGAVTHKDLFFENPVKLPFLNVDLPLTGFFALGPLVFLIVHAYTLLHFTLLADRVGDFHKKLEKQGGLQSNREGIRRQLPSNIFVQFLAGPRGVRSGIIGFMLRLIAWISLIIGPVALLVLFQLQFLPYHDPVVTWWHRIAVFVDVLLLWALWPRIARGTTAGLRWRDFRRLSIWIMLLLSAVPVWLVSLVATFPGEWLHEQIPAVYSQWTPHKLLVACGYYGFAKHSDSRWCNRLMLPGLDLREHSKYDTDAKIDSRPTTLRLHGRRLENAILENAYLPKADFTGAKLKEAYMRTAHLRGARLDRAELQDARLDRAELQGARLNGAQLQGASLLWAQLQGASLVYAQLQGARFDEAQLQDADLYGAELQGVSFEDAQLQGASLVYAQLQGARLDRAQLQGARFGGAQLQGASLNEARLQGADLSGAKLQGASLYEARLQGADLGSAQLQGADLGSAQLQGADLNGAQLQGADLGGAELQGASLF